MRRTIQVIAAMAVLAGLVGCDHATKLVARQKLDHAPAIVLIGGVLDLRYTENNDSAFGTLRWIEPETRRTILLIAAALGVLLIGVLLVRSRSPLEQTGLVLYLAGALGNGLDRAFRGVVVDFIHLHHWPIFNVADILIVVGAGLFVLHHLRGGAWREPPRESSGEPGSGGEEIESGSHEPGLA
jgi:signal peptidase II